MFYLALLINGIYDSSECSAVFYCTMLRLFQPLAWEVIFNLLGFRCASWIVCNKSMSNYAGTLEHNYYENGGKVHYE